MILGTISFVLFILKDQNVYGERDDTFINTFDVSIFSSSSVVSEWTGELAVVFFFFVPGMCVCVCVYLLNCT